MAKTSDSSLNDLGEMKLIGDGIVKEIGLVTDALKVLMTQSDELAKKQHERNRKDLQEKLSNVNDELDGMDKTDSRYAETIALKKSLNKQLRDEDSNYEKIKEENQRKYEQASIKAYENKLKISRDADKIELREREISLKKQQKFEIDTKKQASDATLQLLNQ